MTLRWNLEEINLQDDCVFARGWLWQEDHQVKTIHLILNDQEGRERSRIRMLDGQPRYDVAKAFPSDHGASLNTGFVGLGSWGCRPEPTDQLALAITFAQRESLLLDVSHKVNLPESRRLHWRQKISQRWGLFQRAFSLLIRGDWRGFLYRLSLHAEQQNSQELPQQEAWQRLLDNLSTGKAVQLIVDHQLGGGANAYRTRQVNQWLQQGDIVITLSFQISKLTYELNLQWEEQSHRFTSPSEHAVLEAISHARPRTIVFNNAVSFAGPMRIAPLLLLLKQRSKAKLVVLIHDYFLVCPTIYLLDGQNQFCGVPQLKQCEACLPSCNHLFASFFRGSISSWRGNWGSLLARADQIIAFSEASAHWLKKAYKQWPSWVEIEIKPHQLQFPPGPAIQPAKAEAAVIGVVGQIGVQKGCKIVQELADQIIREQGRESIVVIGSLECRADSRVVRQTGHYQPQELRKLIVNSGANIMLMPSIWPETFSFVTEELIQLDLPLACFDLGAPGERVMRYAKGHLLTSMNAATVLQELRAFYNTIYNLPG